MVLPFPLLLTPLLLLHCTITFAQNDTDACCALTKSALNQLASSSPGCPLASLQFLSRKCQSCPTALCRVNDQCICPRDFLRFSFQRSSCETSFGAIWPDSITKEDRDWRGCQPNVTRPKPIPTSCCAFSEQQLTDLRGFDSNCPSHTYSFRLAQKCNSCPSGLCRLGELCICPDRFLDRPFLHAKCAPFFTASWPQSVGKEDRADRSCRGVPAPRSTRLSCCSINESLLDDMIGTSDRCPDTSPVLLSNACGICPAGMCRFDSSCFCPSQFKESAMKDRCDRVFGIAWPDSVGKTDPGIASCRAGSDGVQGEQEQDQRPDDASHGSKPSESSAAINTTSNANENTASEPRLTTLEVVGVIAGVVSAVVAVAALAIGLSKRKKSRTHEEEPSFDELVG